MQVRRVDVDQSIGLSALRLFLSALGDDRSRVVPLNHRHSQVNRQGEQRAMTTGELVQLIEATSAAEDQND